MQKYILIEGARVSTLKKIERHREVRFIETEDGQACLCPPDIHRDTFVHDEHLYESFAAELAEIKREILSKIADRAGNGKKILLHLSFEGFDNVMATEVVTGSDGVTVRGRLYKDTPARDIEISAENLPVEILVQILKQTAASGRVDL